MTEPSNGGRKETVPPPIPVRISSTPEKLEVLRPFLQATDAAVGDVPKLLALARNAGQFSPTPGGGDTAYLWEILASVSVADFAKADPRIMPVAVELCSVGASRAEGARYALRRTPAPGSVHSLWLANTDADTVVPVHWLSRQMEFAESGVDVVLGSVEPDEAGLDAGTLGLWKNRHPLSENHPYIFGANLGVRGSAYVNAGGFSNVTCHEDRMLVDSLRASGAVLVATDTNRVLTSGRTSARAPFGFGHYLRELGNASGWAAKAAGSQRA